MSLVVMTRNNPGSDMAKVKLFNTEGKEVGQKKLRDDVFGVTVNSTFVHEVVVGIKANARKPWAHTKERSDVRGGGKKPWKQKGTGRARHGSIRSPLWKGGGVTFGSRNERDFTKKINRKAKRSAFFMTLSDKVADDHLLLVEGLEGKEGKTKEVVALIEKLPVEGRVTIVLHNDDKLLARSVKNLKKIRLVSTNSVGIMDVLDSNFVVMTPEATEKIESLAKEKATA